MSWRFSRRPAPDCRPELGTRGAYPPRVVATLPTVLGALGSPSANISGVVKNTPSGVGLTGGHDHHLCLRRTSSAAYTAWPSVFTTTLLSASVPSVFARTLMRTLSQASPSIRSSPLRR